MKHYIIISITSIFLSCWNSPAINNNYDFSQVSSIRLNKILDYSNKPGSGQIMEDNLSFMFIKNGYDVSQTIKDGTIINLNNDQKNNLLLNCTLTEYTDRQTILVPFRIEDRGSIETIITQSTESGEKNNNAMATTSTTTTTDGGSIKESGRVEYTQARVGIILKMTDENTGLLVWSHSYWYSGIELPRTAQICAKNSIGQLSQLLEINN
tara:strand:- start:921 stop:1550 length:630 start_codon:yes stop_codon:yes gene_type:complete